MNHAKKAVLICTSLAFLAHSLFVVTSGMHFPQDGETVFRFIQESEESPPPLGRFVLVIDVSTALHITQPRFSSLTISGGRLRTHLRGFDFMSKKLENMAAALSPSFVRFGGTYSDFLLFDPDAVDTALPDWDVEDPDAFDSNPFKHAGPFNKRFNNFTLSGTLWDSITRFCDRVGWDIMWQFNVMHLDRNGDWNPKSADRFLEYCKSRGVWAPSFQLGNEPNMYKEKLDVDIPPESMAQNFKTLKDLLAGISPYAASGIYGPDVTNLDRHNSARKYLRAFLKSGGCDAVTEMGSHHYYFHADEATLQDFLDINVMDSLKTHIEVARNATVENCRLPKKPIRLTETSTAAGGGVEGMSNAYVAGFLWLDKLGLSAKYGITHVFRQTFFGSKYALIDETMDPNPDFFLTVLYKRLVEGPVFHVVTTGMSPLVRVYAHCVRKGYFNNTDGDGALVVYYLNTATKAAVLSMNEYQNAMVQLFVFTPGDSDGLKSRKVKLNGTPLEMRGDDLPPMEPKLHTGDIPVTPLSFGFIVIPSADVPLCKVYHRSKDAK